MCVENCSLSIFLINEYQSKNERFETREHGTWVSSPRPSSVAILIEVDVPMKRQPVQIMEDRVMCMVEYVRRDDDTMTIFLQFITRGTAIAVKHAHLSAIDLRYF